MSRTQIHRTLLLVGAAVVAITLVAAGSGCTALSRDKTDTQSSSAGQQSLPPSNAGYGDGSAGGPAVTKDELAVGSSPDAAYSIAMGRAGAGTANLTQEQLVIRTGSLRLRVKDITSAIDRIRSVTASFGGVIEDLQVSTEADQPVYRTLASGESGDVAPLGAFANIRVPSKRLEEFTKRVTSFGTVIRQSSTQSDVTQQHIDLAARLKNLRAEESRLRDFLKAAKDVKEMLLVESELSRVRGEIESLQGQLDYLDRQIAYATLSVELVKPAPVVRPSGTDWGFSDAVTNGIQGAAGAVLGIITVSITLLPFALIALVIYLLVRMALRRRHRARAAESSNDDDEGTGDHGPDVSTGEDAPGDGDE